MTPSDPAGQDAGSVIARVIVVITCLGGALLMIALASAAARWLV